MRRERISRPSSSVPHQWAAEGVASRTARSMRAGSCGASHGANSAQITKTTTSTAPAAASGLWRARRGSEMAVVDKLEVYSRASKTTCHQHFTLGLVLELPYLKLKLAVTVDYFKTGPVGGDQGAP